MTNLILVLAFLFSVMHTPTERAAPKYDSIIVVKVENLAGDLYLKISEDLAKDASASMEYACMWSGVMVIKLQGSTISTKGDAQMFIRRRFAPATQMEFLHVYVEQSSGSTKC